MYLPLFESLSMSPFSNFQPNQRVALQQTDVKRCIRSSTDRCRRRGSQPTAWFSLLPNSACEYLFIANRICWFILYYQREETDIIQCFPTLGPKYMCRLILSFVFCFSIFLSLILKSQLMLTTFPRLVFSLPVGLLARLLLQCFSVSLSCFVSCINCTVLDCSWPQQSSSCFGALL